MAVLTLSVFPKQDLNSLINSSKLFNMGEFFSNRGANHAKAVPLVECQLVPLGMHRWDIEKDAFGSLDVPG